MDVKLLYMNIPDTEGASTVKAAFECYPGKSVSIKVIVTFLALSTANITNKEVVQWEQLVHQVMQASLWPDFKRNIIRYIRDILMTPYFIWKGT